MLRQVCLTWNPCPSVPETAPETAWKLQEGRGGGTRVMTEAGRRRRAEAPGATCKSPRLVSWRWVASGTVTEECQLKKVLGRDCPGRDGRQPAGESSRFRAAWRVSDWSGQSCNLRRCTIASDGDSKRGTTGTWLDQCNSTVTDCTTAMGTEGRGWPLGIWGPSLLQLP